MLHSSVQHATMYSELCKRIIQYWEVPVDAASLTENTEVGFRLANGVEEGSYSTSSQVILGKSSHDTLELAGSSSGDMVVPGLENICEEPGSREGSIVTLMEHGHPGHRKMENDCTTEQALTLQVTNSVEQSKVETTGSVNQLADSSDLSRLKLTGTTGNNNYTNIGSGSTCIPAIMLSQARVANFSVSGKGCKNVANDCIYMGSSFKAQAYINHYTHGDFAACAASSFTILSSEENRVSAANAFENSRKMMAANISLQVKAFSSAAIRFFWPNSERKLVEVPRERCGWCLSCKATNQSKKGCLLNAAASNAIKGTMKILSGIRPVKSGEGSLHSMTTYMMFMEESLRGLTVGPFLSSAYRKQWCKEAEQALTCSTIKNLLLEVSDFSLSIAYI